MTTLNSPNEKCPKITLLWNHISNKTMKPFKIEKLIEVQVSDGPVYLAWLRDYEYL